MIDEENNRQAKVREQFKQYWEEKWREENDIRRQKDDAVAQKRARKEQAKQELRQ